MAGRERRVPIGRLTLGIAVLVAAAAALTHGGGAPRFRTLQPGVEFATVQGDPYCRMGPSDIAVLRLDPRRVRLRMAHYTQLPDRAPLDILDWERRIGALAVFNAGQYYPDYSYMGLFVSQGKPISPHAHGVFKAALVADPARGGAAAHVLDLDREPLPTDPLPWREVAQSFLLFDDTGKIHVRRSNLTTYRTIVGEDHQGRLLVISTEGGYTLYELAGLLRTLPLGLTRAMSMDGGEEATLTVNAGGFRYANFGHRLPNGEVPNPLRPTVPLPAVVAVLAP